MIKKISFSLLQKLFIATLVLVLSGCSHLGQQVVVAQDFKPGMTYNYLLQKTITSDSTGRRSTTTTTKTYIRFQVLRSVNDLRECTWTYGPTVPLGANPDSLSHETMQYLNYNKGLTVKFFIGKQGRFQGLNNLDECQAFMDSAYHSIFAGLGDRNKLEDVMNKVIRPMYKTDQDFLNTFCQDIVFLFGNFGDTLQRGESLSSRSTMRLPVLDTEVSLVFTERIKDITGHTVTIRFEQKISPAGIEAFKAGASNAVKKLNDSQQEDENIEMLYSSNGTLIYDTKKKAITELSNQKTVHVNEERRTDAIKITLQE